MFFKKATECEATECDVTASQVGGKKGSALAKACPIFSVSDDDCRNFREETLCISASVAEYRSWIYHEGRLLQARSKEIYRDIPMWQRWQHDAYPGSRYWWPTLSYLTYPLFKFESCIYPTLKSPWCKQKQSAPITGFAVRFAKVSIVAKYSSRDMKTST